MAPTKTGFRLPRSRPQAIVMHLTTPAPGSTAALLSNPSAPAQSPTAIFEAYQKITGAIEGWFSDGASAVWDSLLSFQRSQDIRGDLCEIGVWHGKAAALMAMHAAPGSKLILADYQLKAGPIQRSLAAAQPAAGVEVLTIGCDSRELHVHPIVGEHFQKVRWMHIDGQHTARAISSDMALANMLLASDGVLVIDDFFSWLYPQITEAVFRYLRTFPDDFSLFLCGYEKAYLARPHAVHRYLEFCAQQLPEDLEARGKTTTVGKTTLPAEMNTFGVGPRFQNKALRGPDWEPNTIRY